MRDVIIVGAGPAGSSAAYHCAKAGLDVLLLEQSDLPRDKPCGGMLSPRYVDTLQLWDTVDVRADRCRLLVNHEDIGWRDAPACLVDRGRFDHALAAKAVEAGAELRTGVEVEAMEGGDVTKVKVGGEVLESKVLIGADGVNSLVRRSTGLEGARQRPDRIVSLVVELPLGKDRIDEVLGNDGSVYFDINFSTFLPGYAWIFPKKDRLNIGIGAVASHGRDLRSALERFAVGMGLGSLKGAQLRGALIPYRPLTRVREGGVLLVGDAAGLVNPFTGGGIDLAIGSGEAAARACAAALDGGDLGLLSMYEKDLGPILRSLRNKSRLVDMATKLMENGLDSPRADRIVLRLFNRMA